MPKISVIMPAYNAEKYIGEAIDSILGQTFEDFEFIILNDCSTDRTEEIILFHPILHETFLLAPLIGIRNKLLSGKQFILIKLVGLLWNMKNK